MKKIILFVLALFVLLPLNAWDSFDTDTDSEIYTQNKKHNFAVAYETSTYSYREPYLEFPPHWDGSMQGVSAKYTGKSMLSEGAEINPADNSFFSFELRYMQGKVDYDGYLQNGTVSKANDISDYYIEGALNAGIIYDLGQSGFSIWPYLGLGVRYLVDKLDESGPSGYRRNSTYIYMPLGFNLTKEFSYGWSLTANGQFDWLLSGQQKSEDMGDAITINNKQNDGYGLRGSIKLAKQFTNFGVFVEPFIRYWHIQTSEAEYITDGFYLYKFVEPENQTREYGLKAGIMF